MTNLVHLSNEWVDGRRARGEITASSRVDLLSRLTALTQAHGDRPASELDRATILRWQAAIGHHSAATRRSYLSAVKTFCKWLVIEGHIPADPTIGLARVKEPRRIPRALPTIAVARTLAVCKDNRSRAIIWLEVGCGLRCVEVANLDVDDYDPVALTLHIRGKAGHERVVPVPTEARPHLDAYLDEVGWMAGPLIQGQRHAAGKRIGRARVSTIVGELMTEAGVHRAPRDGRTAHALRHTCASDILDTSHDLRLVQGILGHANIATTERYLRRADLGKMREAMEGRTYLLVDLRAA